MHPHLEIRAALSSDKPIDREYWRHIDGIFEEYLDEVAEKLDPHHLKEMEKTLEEDVYISLKNDNSVEICGDGIGTYFPCQKEYKHGKEPERITELEIC
ncbi:MAG: hypothetical protein ACLFS3_00835 [Candidatus Aenigmatarchaeota archaeon]